MILDGQTHPALVKLAACAHTSVDRNCNFNLMRLFSDRCKLGDLIRRINGDGGVSCMVLPSTFSRWFHSIDRPKFLKMWGADATILERFWTSLFSSQEGREYRQMHPGIRNKTPFDLRHTIPVTIHEDATPFTKRKGTNVVSWSPLLGMGTDIVYKIGTFTYIKTAGQPLDFCKDAWNLFLADLEAMEAGIVDGIPVLSDPDGVLWKFCAVFGKGDGEVNHVAWGVAGYSSVDKVCGSCHADRDGMPWSNLLPGSLWRHVPFSGAQFLAQCRYGHPVTDSRY